MRAACPLRPRIDFEGGGVETTIMWFRRDLRLNDNSALRAAADGSLVVPAFVWPDPADASAHGAQARWLDRSLASLDAMLRSRGSGLVVRTGPAAEALAALATECHASRVVATRQWTPAGAEEQSKVAERLAAQGARLDLFDDAYLVPPDGPLTSNGGPFKVFSAYYRAWRSRISAGVEPDMVTGVLPRPSVMPASAGPLSPPPGGPDLTRWWQPGEPGAAARLERFLAESLADYDTQRDVPAVRGTSELSPHLAWGEISPRHVYQACVDRDAEAAEPFIRQLAWREFAAHVLHHFPHTTALPMRPEFENMPWVEDPGGLAAWKAGRTGYPLVDAGMRQLAQTGWMHNRVRLVAASLLTKHLLIDWRLGEQHFREALVDFDAASNSFNWQWVAGSGADAAPYFRIFNPTLQGARFDPEGEYVRAWVPELAGLDARWVHRPWEAPAAVLSQAGVLLGETYPLPVIEHAEGRERALAAFASVRKTTARR